VSDVLIPVSVGELLDKVSILRLKAARIADPEKLANVRAELQALDAVAEGLRVAHPALAPQEAALAEVNGALWDVEDALRLHERREDFGAEFVRLARLVYVTNDRRAAIKRAINAQVGSRLVEEKSYDGG
jgi:hypothetical protein